MFPVILGVTLAFLLVVGISVGVVIDRFKDSQEMTASQDVTVPDLMGQVMTEDTINQYTKQGFKITVTYDDSQPDIEVNTVLAQSPEAGIVRKIIPGQQYCDINLTLSRGKDAKVLPDLTVKDYREVEIKLGEMGLKFVEEFEENDNIPVGYVIRTMPMAGEKVNAGETVTLYISKGTDVKYIQVPNFIGLNEAQAKAQLVQYNLALGEITYEQSSKPKGTVIDQSREAYESVPEKTTKIDLVISSGQ